MRPFAERLQKTRVDQGISRTKLAELSGVSKRSIDQYEHDKATPTVYMAVYLAQALHVSLDFLCGMTDWRY